MTSEMGHLTCDTGHMTHSMVWYGIVWYYMVGPVDNRASANQLSYFEKKICIKNDTCHMTHDT